MSSTAMRVVLSDGRELSEAGHVAGCPDPVDVRAQAVVDLDPAALHPHADLVEPELLDVRNPP
jgi:hypothetical protein